MFKISRWTKLGILVLFISLILLALLKWVLLPLATSVEFKNFVENLGIFGYFIVIVYTVISHIFAPLSSAPGLILAVSLYGVLGGLVLLYLGSLLGATVNFYISRLYGRELVRKLAGKKTMAQVDEFTTVSGRKALWASRLLGFAVFEVVSYAAGLTTIKFRPYILITVFANLLVYALTYWIFVSARVEDEVFILAWVISVFAVGALFIYLVHAYLKSRKNNSFKKIMTRIFKR